MRRRDALLGAAAVAATPWAAAGQEVPKRARIGFIVTGEAFPRRYFDEAMRRLGWTEGRNLIVERRITGEDPERRKSAAAELVAGTPDVIVAAGAIDARAVLAATRTIPIVVVSGTDLVENGLVASLPRPGGNVTGMVIIGAELDGKRLELLRELVPAGTRLAMTATASNPRQVARVAAVEALARPLGVRVVARLISRPDDIDAAYAASAADGDQAILVQQSTLTFENQPRVVASAAQFCLPAIYELREYVESGGLVSYGQVWRENFERAAALVDKILKGANPADLPVEQPTRFELVVNLNTAKALGLTVPPSILSRADEVIE